ncbi:efflux RND transporter periplasmic adaptor subunit [Colwellia psychrerythraea]|uniref:Efflux transporter, RND family, MFP subunit n=1 Tax=Colwellia psychrerythraea (strain 34H / ATCC BAA-681) TaxID=167879 RepID=Q488J1_COLP3|nr:HlyD family efflux transporter periplasmic adaptor subunit [Colwellia psychrerythraea]AAZ24671.1 efflux transporter, RND family, MFP subunit [Colwellia psychrerythraea 34H]
MDIQREAVQKPLWKKYWFVLPVFILLIGTYSLRNVLGNASYFIERSAVVTAKVEQGDFRVNVRATGVLKPLNIRWVSSQVSGRAEQVLVKAGAKVNKGDVLVQLSNPELHRNLEKARWELEAKKAESHVAFVMLESQMVDLENSVLSAEYSYQSAKLKLDAETALLAQGNATVSALEYQRSQLTVKQQMQYWRAQQQKTEKMKANMAATKIAQQARIGLVENNYQRVQEQVAALQVRSSTSGVVQQVSLELGERAQVGDSVALVADQNTLFAELQVQEVRVRDIALGQLVTIDTRTTEIIGEVTRIDPAVKSGMVLVDVKLIGDLPAEARPELTVDGLIAISNIENALYVKRPVYAPRHTKVGLYKLSQDQQFASKYSVGLGQSSVNKIQIIDGLMLGDEIIISDTSSWQEHQEIKIN